MQAGHGEPLMVGRGNTRRVLIGGASLCSPGMWTPERRLRPTGVAAKLHEALCFELTKLGNSREGGLEGLLADLTAGRLLESPFPAEATQQLRDYVADLTTPRRVSLNPGKELQPQPVDVLLLGIVLRALGDPDWKDMRTYAVGVPLGLGVYLPRTPAVCPLS